MSLTKNKERPLYSATDEQARLDIIGQQEQIESLLAYETIPLSTLAPTSGTLNFTSDLSAYRFIDVYFTTASGQAESSAVITLDSRVVIDTFRTTINGDYRFKILATGIQFIYIAGDAPYVKKVVGRNI